MTGRVPTPDERAGSFPAPIRDPLTGQPFPGNMVPASRINATSALLLERYVPLPNVNAANNFLQQFGTPFDSDQYTIRIDHEFGPNDRFMARYFSTGASSFSASNRLPGFGRVMDTTITNWPLPTRMSSGRIC